MIFGWPKSEEAAKGSRKLVVGLGNPGKKYQGTRHNVGFEVVGQLARNWDAGKVKRRFKGEIADIRMGDKQVCLLCPETYMNASGSSVKLAVDFYKLDLHDVLVVCDDFAIELARLRIRPQGSAGGQKGLQDVIRRVGTDSFPRLRVGIGKPPASWDLSDFVLSRFSAKEKVEMEIAVRCAADAVADWVTDGIDYCMNKYNGK